MTIGVVIPDITNALFPPIVRGIESVLEPEGYASIIVNTDNVPERETRLVDVLAGILIWPESTQSWLWIGTLEELRTHAQCGFLWREVSNVGKNEFVGKRFVESRSKTPTPD